MVVSVEDGHDGHDGQGLRDQHDQHDQQAQQAQQDDNTAVAGARHLQRARCKATAATLRPCAHVRMQSDAAAAPPASLLSRYSPHCTYIRDNTASLAARRPPLARAGMASRYERDPSRRLRPLQ